MKDGIRKGVGVVLVIAAVLVNGGEARKPALGPALKIRTAGDSLVVSWDRGQAMGYFVQETKEFQTWAVVYGPIGADESEWKTSWSVLAEPRYYRLRK